MIDLIFILLIGLSALFFTRSWFVVKTKKVVSLLLLILSIGAQPGFAYFIVSSSSEEPFITMVICMAALITSLFTFDKKQVDVDRILAINLIILSLYAVILSSLVNFDYYIGYYNRQIINAVSISYLVIVVLFNYRFYSKGKGK